MVPDRVKTKVRKPTRQLGVGDATIGELEKQFVLDVLNHNRLSYGPYIASFEREFAHLHDCRHAIFCNSGTSALQVALHALKEQDGWHEGDEVLVPALTFIATSNVVLHNRLQPVFVDIDPVYYTIDPAKIEEKMTAKTRAIIPVHVFGHPCEMKAIQPVARAHHLRIVEDSCEAMFVKDQGQPVGSLGDVACFSTYVAHLIVTGVGGMVTTNNEDLAVLVRSLVNHGRDDIYLSMDADNTDDVRTLFEVVRRRFSFVHLGYSYRATEMEGALGLAQLRRKDEILGAHQRNAAYLTTALRPFEEYLQLPVVRPGAEHAFMMYPIVIRDARIPRDDLVRFLEENLIETRYLLPLLSQPVYRRLFGDLEAAYPVARTVSTRGFYIGCHQGLSGEDLEYIVETFARFFQTRRA